jgi:hypothetical protein
MKFIKRFARHLVSTILTLAYIVFILVQCFIAWINLSMCTSGC